MGLYYVQNHEVIARTADHHDFAGDWFWWKIDRERRTCLDEATGIEYDIPESINLGAAP